jgi:hypothetical protein
LEAKDADLAPATAAGGDADDEQSLELEETKVELRVSPQRAALAQDLFPDEVRMMERYLGGPEYAASPQVMRASFVNLLNAGRIA